MKVLITLTLALGVGAWLLGGCLLAPMLTSDGAVVLTVGTALGLCAGLIARSMADPGLPSWALMKAERARQRELHARAAIFVSAGTNPRLALRLAEDELGREAHQVLQGV